MSSVHPTAIVDPKCELGRDVVIGPYSVLDAGVIVGDGCRIGAHVVVEGQTRLGRSNTVHPYACLGTAPQDLKYDGTPTRLEIGDGNTIREFATVNRGTVPGGGTTRVGSNNLLMAYSHVAHDCLIGDSVVMANAATLAGHVTISDFAIVGGLVAIHQHVRIGESAILGGGAMVSLDVPPFCTAAGDRAKLHGLNMVGLRRRGMSDATIDTIRAAYRILFQSRLRLVDAVARLRAEYPGCAEVMRMADFVSASRRGICR